MLAGLLKPDDNSHIPLLNVSYKPQKIAPKFEGTVRQLLHAKIRGSYTHPQFVTDVSGRSTHTRTSWGHASAHPSFRDAPARRFLCRFLFADTIKSCKLSLLVCLVFFSPQVMKPMNIEDIIDQEVKNLSGGELQRTNKTQTEQQPRRSAHGWNENNDSIRL